MDTGALRTAARAGSVITVDGVAIALRRTGVGPPVVCLHATGHGGRDYDDMGARLAQSFETIAIDWPGQGDSGPDVTPASAARYAALLEGVIDQLQIKRAILIGNSIGGAAAIIYGARRPERVRGLVLCNTGGVFAVNWFVRWYCARLAQRFRRGAAGDRNFGPWFARYYRGILREPAAAARREEIVTAGCNVAGTLAEAWESFGRADADIRYLVPQLTMPVLYAWAKHDRALPWALARKAAMSAPDARVALFNGGHSAFLEQPGKFARAFLDFADALPA